MNNENFKTLAKVFQETPEGVSVDEATINNNGFSIRLEKHGDDLKIYMSEIKHNNKRDEFEKWLNSIDDDIFEEAYAEMQEMFGLSLHNLDEVYNDDRKVDSFIKDFTNIIKKIAESKVQKLIDKYALRRNC